MMEEERVFSEKKINIKMIIKKVTASKIGF